MYTITREIGIDTGHRVPTHGSKCANLHGHRYTIKATCSAENLQGEGEQEEMVLDFGFLKDIMMQHIDRLCDHGMILWRCDPWVHLFLDKIFSRHRDLVSIASGGEAAYLFQEGDRGRPTKLLVVNFIPTAEALAKFWFNLMNDDVKVQSGGHARLMKITVHETPNCFAEYIPFTRGPV